jgi:hypothetical protein
VNIPSVHPFRSFPRRRCSPRLPGAISRISPSHHGLHDPARPRRNYRTLRRFTVLMCPRAVPSLFLLKQQRQTVTTILPTFSLHRTPLQSSVSTLGLCAIFAHFQMSEDWMEIRRRLKTPTLYRSASRESVSKRARRHFYFFIRPPHKLLCAPRSPWIANTASVLYTTYCEYLRLI